jgi:hypothetical protein
LRDITIVFGAAFLLFLGGSFIAPNMILGHFQDDIVAVWDEAGVDTSACKGSIPALGIGVQKCFEGSIKDLAEKINEAREDGADFERDQDE